MAAWPIGPKPRKYDQKTPKKMIKLALHSALSDRAADGKIVVVDSWWFDAPKTKDAKKVLSALGVEGKALIVVDIDDTNTIKSFLNLPEVQLIESRELNAYDVLCSDYVIFSHATLPGGGEVIAAAPAETKATQKAQTDKVAEAEEVAPKVVSADVPKEASAADDEPAATWVGSVTADGPDAPEGYEIKGNAQSMLYHVPGSRYYKATKAEYWFDTVDNAEAAGFAAPGADNDEESAGETS